MTDCGHGDASAVFGFLRRKISFSQGSIMNATHMNNVGISGISMPTSAACCLYYNGTVSALFDLMGRLFFTLSPTHRIVPTSSESRGDKTRSINEVNPVS
jgi:hypothetical protein